MQTYVLVSKPHSKHSESIDAESCMLVDTRLIASAAGEVWRVPLGDLVLAGSPSARALGPLHSS